MAAALLATVALAFTGTPTGVHCPPRLPGGDAAAFVIQDEHSAHIFMPRRTCRALVWEPTRETLDTFTHELIHVRFPQVRHGTQMQRAIREHLPIVARLIRTVALRTAYKQWLATVRATPGN